MESDSGAEKIGLCPHGTLVGLCTKCRQTDRLEPTDESINEPTGEKVEGDGIGSTISKELKEETDITPYDVVMVLGAGFQERRLRTEFNKQGEPMDPNQYKPGWMLNIESRMRLNASAQLYFEGRARIICLTGGSAISEQWQSHGALADLGKRYLIEKFHIPEEDIVLENVSDATHGNLAHGLRQLYRENIPTGSMAIISTAYHLPRAAKMAEMSGIGVDTIPAERLLLERSPHYSKFIANWGRHVEEGHLEEAERAKLEDEKYWEERTAVFTTPLDRDVPPVDISKSVAETAKIIREAGGEPESAF